MFFLCVRVMVIMMVEINLVVGLNICFTPPKSSDENKKHREGSARSISISLEALLWAVSLTASHVLVE